MRDIVSRGARSTHVNDRNFIYLLHSSGHEQNTYYRECEVITKQYLRGAGIKQVGSHCYKVYASNQVFIRFGVRQIREASSY